MDNRKVTADMVRREYQKHIGAYLRTIPDSALQLRVMLAADVYFRKCALWVWTKGDGVTEAHVEAYNAICSKGSASPGALYFEVVSGVGSAGRFAVPVFYEDLLICDAAQGSRTAEKFRSLCETMLLLFAAVDDKVTEEEAGYVAECMAYLRVYLPGGVSPVTPPASGRRDGSETDAGQQAERQSEAAAETKPEEQPEPPKETVEELLAQLDELCGLDQVKKDVHSMINLIKVRKLRESNGLPVPPMSLHLVFMGNPGTGKTTVARLVAKLYHAIGVLPKGQLVEVDRSGLVAGYVGQTAAKTQAAVDKAMGGVLFIDEAYALANQRGENDFGKEAIEVLLKNMEDHRDQLIVIVAGYVDLMGDFISSNPGLESRFNKYFYFEDYNGDQMNQIFLSMCKKNGYTPDEEAKTFAKEEFNRMYDQRTVNFGNARDVRNLFETLVAVQADRVSQLESPTVEDLMTVTAADMKAAAADENEEPKEPQTPELTLTPEEIPAEPTET